jgi:hypothetical protein
MERGIKGVLEEDRKDVFLAVPRVDNHESSWFCALQYLEEEYRKGAREDDPMPPVQPYHYGSHYSNSGTVLHFLVRMPPFTKMFLAYQGKDVFHSHPKSHSGSSGKKNFTGFLKLTNPRNSYFITKILLRKSCSKSSYI